ncbi:MAG: tRNA 2-thiouridine(34) synthase MnmA [Thermodesulfobacteriota bacterium]|nr:tRNA 2-thiouridine(34) synthase MnmA [Thermodesulfobacteriota bacterium]
MPESSKLKAQSQKPNNTSVLVALSGGVDSALAAHDLLQAGWHTDAFFLNILPEVLSDTGLFAAKSVAKHLGIRLHCLNEAEKFENEVISYFRKSYNKGLTPNPCVICNNRIKVFIGLSLANSLDIDYLATGHYARTKRLSNGRTGLFKAKDLKKDQSYFLHQIPKEAISRLIFPLGDHTKKEVMKQATETGIFPLVQKESQEICFLKGNYRTFLEKRGFFNNLPGDIVTIDGKVLGRHAGLYAYTVGQRQGIGIPDKTPYYVAALDMENNRLVVGKENNLRAGELFVEHINWLVSPDIAFKQPCTVKIRYRHPGGLAKLELLESGKVRVCFFSDQWAITPGQFAVFYLDDLVLGGGSICG